MDTRLNYTPSLLTVDAQLHGFLPPLSIPISVDVQHEVRAHCLVSLLSMIHLLAVKESRKSRPSVHRASRRFDITRHIGKAILYPPRNLRKAYVSPYPRPA